MAEAEPKNDRSPAADGFISYGEGQVLEVRVEKEYGVQAYLDILKRECISVRHRILQAVLPEACFDHAREKAEAPSVRVANHHLPARGTLAWQERYKKESDAPLPPPPQRPGPLERLADWALPVAKGVRQKLEACTAVYLANGATLSPKQNHLLGAGTELKPVRLGEALPGMRVPMFSQYGRGTAGDAALSVADRPVLVVDRKAQEELPDEIEDALFKLGAEGPLVEGRLGVPRAAVTSDRTEEPLRSGAPRPRISVVLVSFNQRRFLAEAIDSILGQGYPNLELIVIDGGSSDGSAELLERYRKDLAHLVIEPDRGQSHALNKGFALSTGDLMTWLCSDDLLEPGSLMAVAEAYDKTRADLIAGQCRLIDGEGRAMHVHSSAYIAGRVSPLSFGDLAGFTASWQRSLYFFQPEVFFTRRIWDRSGAHLKEHLHYAMDYDLFLRFALAGATIFPVRRVLASSRQHSDQKTRHEVPSYLPTVERILSDFRSDLQQFLPARAA